MKMRLGWLVLLALSAVACSSSSGAGSGAAKGAAGSAASGSKKQLKGAGNNAADAGDRFGNAPSGGQAGSATGLRTDAAAGVPGSGPGRPGASSPEVCDGVDNDGNGIIDDVDVDHDGVCDCLAIATIGEIGPWSNGGDVFKNWLASRSPQGAVALGDIELTDDVLKPFQVIVVLYSATSELSAMGRTLAPHHAFSDAEVAALERWIRQGGGLMTTIGYQGDEAHEVENVNRLLAPLGLGYSTTKTDLTGYITDWTQHPLTDGVMKIFTDNGVEPDGPSGQSLARDSGGRVALRVAQVDAGRVVVWGDEWITYDSQWQDVKDQQVARFWLNILKWLSPPKVCQVAIPVL